MKTRIAPTPSGYLHEGNVLSFLATAMLAEEHQGGLLLRIDDLDAERQRPEYVEDIFDTLNALGINWNEGPRSAQDLASHWSQLLRLDRYRALVDRLKQADDLYACACSRAQRDACVCAGKEIPFEAAEVVWRLRIPEDATVRMRRWSVDEEEELRVRAMIEEPVIRQRNGRPAYQIASLADDVDYGIDTIVRGADLLPSTVCQLYLAERLGLRSFLEVRFLHHPLITDAEGRKLSKSQGAPAWYQRSGAALRTLRERAKAVLASIS